MSMKDIINHLIERKSNNQQQGSNGRQEESENPYLAARRTWNDQSAANVANRQMWQLLGILSLMIALAGIGGMIHIGSQSKFVPYVVEVDKLGQAVAVAPAQQAGAVNPRIVHSTVASFVSDIRMVSPDIALQRKAIFRVYSYLSPNDAATAKANEWLNGTEDSSPFKRAEHETVSIEIETTIPQTQDTWQVDWIETTRDRQGVIKGAPQRMRGLVTVHIAESTPETTEEQIINNPLGIYIRDFSWSKLL